MEARAEDTTEAQNRIDEEVCAVEGVRFLSREEGRAFFDEQARKLLGISGEEFLRRWDAGEYDDIFDEPDHPEIMDLHMMEGFGR